MNASEIIMSENQRLTPLLPAKYGLILNAPGRPTKMKITAICAIVLTFAFYYVYAQSLPNPSDLKDLAKRFKEASSERQKLNLCIEAMDKHLLENETPVKTFDGLFGTDFTKSIPSKKSETAQAALMLADQPEPAGDAVANDYVGWYLAIEFDARGLIRKYYLTNLHK
jgi:hypothetical protein